MRLNKLFLGVSTLALLLMLGLSVGPASAAVPGQVSSSGVGNGVDSPDRPVRIMGRVDQVGERGLLLTTRHGPIRVLVGDNTTIMVNSDGECVEGTLEDIEIGRPALVAGVTTAERGVILARGIRQCRAPGGSTDN